MGKIRGIFQFTGKIGEAVGMKGDDGQNYARVRVREVNNPKTEAQQDTRTIASLAGKISSITPAEILKGMRGSNKRQRRSAFTKNIMLKATTVKDVVSGNVQAILEAKDLVLAEGQTAPLPSLTPTIASGVISVVHSAWPEDLAAVVIVAYGSTEDELYVECKHTVVLPSDQSPETITMSKTITAATVYAIPVMRTAGASNTSYESALEALEENREFAVSSTAKDAASLSYQRSEFLAAVQQGE